MGQIVLRPQDIAVALELALEPGEGFAALAEAVGLSMSEAHGSVKRLTQARLLSREARRIAPSALLNFIGSGVPHAFPAIVGAEARGIPTAAAGPPLAKEFPSAVQYVWPSAEGKVRGQSLTPLYPKAVGIALRRPGLYELLTLVDALRVGQARERRRATQLLQEHLVREDDG